MAFTDLTTAHLAKVQTLRNTQESGDPTRPLDSTTLFANEIKRIRDLDVTVTPLDTDTELAQAWLVST